MLLLQTSNNIHGIQNHLYCFKYICVKLQCDQNNNGLFYLNQNSMAIRILEGWMLWKWYSNACVCAKSLQLCPTLCDPMDCSWPGSSVQGILQARRPEWVAMPSSRGSSWPRDPTCISCTAGGFSTTEPPGKLNILIRIKNIWRKGINKNYIT